MSYRIRPAAEGDLPHLMELIKRLAVYERLIGSYTATEELYRRYGFGEEAIWRALLVENTGGEGPEYLGMALIFVFAGLIGAAIGLGGFLFDAVRNVEDILPDHDAVAATPEAGTASGDAPE